MRFTLNKSHKTFFQNTEDFNYFKKPTNNINASLSILPGSGVPLNYIQKKYYNSCLLKNDINIVNVARIIPTKGLLNYCKVAEFFKLKTNLNIHFFIQSSFKIGDNLSNYEKSNTFYISSFFSSFLWAL